MGMVLPAVAASQDQTNDNVRIVTSGVILKIDAKKKTFQFRITLDAFPRGFGGSSGRGRNGGPFPRRSQGPVNPQAVPVVEVKVYVSQKTALKSQGETFNFATFRVGDRVSVTGIHRGKGTDIDAIEIDRSASR
jgi:hypothetical protein